MDSIHDEAYDIISFTEMMVKAKGHAVMDSAGNEGVFDGAEDFTAGWRYLGAGSIGRAPVYFWS